MRYGWCSPNLQPKSEPKPSNQVSEDTVAWMPAYQCQGIRECRQLARLAGNEGVGEHVRTRFQTGRSSGETAAPPKGKDPHRTKKPGFFYWTNSMTVQPLDLMSRRHPLSSTGALWFVPSAPMTCRQRSPPASSKSGETYFFLATLRVFFAVFFTALFAFFAFFAFLAIVPSDLVRWLYLLRALGNRDARHPEYTNTAKKTASRLRKC